MYVIIACNETLAKGSWKRKSLVTQTQWVKKWRKNLSSRHFKCPKRCTVHCIIAEMYQTGSLLFSNASLPLSEKKTNSNEITVLRLQIWSKTGDFSALYIVCYFRFSLMAFTQSLSLEGLQSCKRSKCHLYYFKIHRKLDFVPILLIRSLILSTKINASSNESLRAWSLAIHIPTSI